MGNFFYDLLTRFLAAINDAAPAPDWATLGVGTLPSGAQNPMDGGALSEDPLAGIGSFAGQINNWFPLDGAFILIGIWLTIYIVRWVLVIIRRCFWN